MRRDCEGHPNLVINRMSGFTPRSPAILGRRPHQGQRMEASTNAWIELRAPEYKAHGEGQPRKCRGNFARR